MVFDVTGTTGGLLSQYAKKAFESFVLRAPGHDLPAPFLPHRQQVTVANQHHELVKRCHAQERNIRREKELVTR